jgi:peptide/nickel transport system substrate-binding protein
MKNGKIYTLLVVLMVSAFASTPVSGTKGDFIFYYGVGSLAVDLDPHQAWDSASIDLINQVSEGLFGYDLADAELAIIPVLADGMGVWNAEATEYTVDLKQNVTFHDGTAFDANDVKWSFDRLNWLITNGSSQLAELYEPLDGELLIAETVVVDAYTVKFMLNYAYVPFVPLLCFSGSVILSEESTPAETLLDIATDLLVGTGPYMHTFQSSRFTQTYYFSNWHGVRPANYLREILWILYEDGTAKNQEFLSGGLDWVDGILPEFLGQYNDSEDIVLGDQRQGTVILYMGMNNKLISLPMRQALSWATDYDYIIDTLALGNAVRLTSPVPEGIMYHNPNLNAPTYNLTTARQIIIDAGLAPVGAIDHIDDTVWWTDIAASATPIATYNFTWNTGNTFRENLGLLCIDNYADIGVLVEPAGMVWADYLDRLLGEFDKLQLYSIGWGPDYNDPSNFINPLFSNTSASNGAQVNDPTLQTMMMEGLVETDPETRRDLYYDMQEYIVETLMPWVFLYVGLGYGAWSVNVGGILRNPMGNLQFSSMFWTGADIDYPADTIFPDVYNPDATDDDAADDDGPGIPGYTFIGLLGAAAITLGIIYKKRK